MCLVFYLIGQLDTDHVMFKTQYHQLETNHVTSQYRMIGYDLMVLSNECRLATHTHTEYLDEVDTVVQTTSTKFYPDS